MPPPSDDTIRAQYHGLSVEDKVSFVKSLSPKAFERFYYNSNIYLREKQIVPAEVSARYVVVLAGRGFGKTEMGAHWIAEHIRRKTKGIAIVGPTIKDLEDTMVPAILNKFPRDKRPVYVSGYQNKIKCPNGVTVYCYTSEVEIRGPNLGAVWCDEFCKWNQGIEDKAEETFKILDFACRLGKSQLLITTTPKPFKQIIKWRDEALAGNPRYYLVSGSTSENEFLSASARDAFIGEYGGTRLGRQELNGEILEDVEGAIWVLLLW